MFRTTLYAAVLVGLTAQQGTEARAQSATDPEMTEQQILDAFARQKTRGLAIAPAQPADGAVPTAAAAPEATTEVSFDAVPRDEQVNVNIAFDFDSAALRADQKPRLETLCNAMRQTDAQTFRILGHTDASGSADYNKRLSLLRAEEVKRHLVSNCGIAAERMIAVGVGEQYPYDPDDPRGDVNRRVEFQVLG